jgi:hypothetical protein
MFGNDGKYQVPLARVRFSATVGEDEMGFGFPVQASSRSRAANITGQYRNRRYRGSS